MGTDPTFDLYPLKDRDLVELPQGHRLHRQAQGPWEKLQELALKEGIQLGVVSAYRGFDRQLAIWNEKARGPRKVWDDHGREVDLSRLKDTEKIHRILRFSALPGLSRHHWGSDLDVYDRALGEVPELQAHEYAPGGPYARLAQWLEQKGPSCGFGQPYTPGPGGVAWEPWHISYLPLAHQMLSSCTPEQYEDFYLSFEEEEFALIGAVRKNLGELLQRYHLFYSRGPNNPLGS